MHTLISARAKSRVVLALAAAAAVGAMAVGPNAAQAADGQWTGAAGGLWGDTNNWNLGIVADAGGIGSFNALNLSGDVPITIDAPRTLSTLTVLDTTVTSAGRYVFSDAGIPANNLTLSGAVTVSNGGISLGGTAVMSAAALNVAGIAGSTNPRPTFSVDGGSFTASGTSQITGTNTGAAGQFILNSGSATFNGALRTSNNENVIIRIAGGTFSAADLDVQRNSAGTVSFTSGIIVTGGTSTVGTVQLGSNNSNGAMSIEGGSFTANGAITVARQATAGRGGAMRVTGGTFTSTDTTDGLILSRVDEAGNANQVAAATFSGGVSTVEKVTMGYDAGVNAGTATLTVSGGALYLGSGGIVRNGTGTFASNINLTSGILGAKSNWASSVNMNLTAANTISIKAADASDVARNITLNGVLSGAGGFTKTGAGTLTLGGPNNYTGTATVSQGTLAGTTTSVRGTITNDSNVTFDQSTAGTFTGAIGGTGTVSKAGAGTVTLSPQTYTGATTVEAGTLAITGAYTSSSGFAVENGATLALAGNASVNTLTFGAAGGDAQTLLVNSGSGVNSLGVTTTNGLVAHGTTTIDVGSLSLSVGDFTLLDYDGAIGGTGGGFGAFTLGSLPPRVTANLVNNTANTSIDLDISAIAEPPRWNGNVNGNWDIGTITPPTGTQNWRELSNNNPTVYLESAVPGDQVLFDDSATGTTSVNIVAPVNPSLVTVNNPTKNYTFSGAKIGGPTPLIKQGAGTLTLSNTGNDYTGGTTIQAGTILLGVANALPTAGPVTAAGGTLDLGGLSQDLSGALVLDGGTVSNGTVNKSGADYDLRSGTASAVLAGSVGVTKTTAGTVTLSGAASYTGATSIQNGTVQLGVANALPTGTTLTLGSGTDSGSLNLNGFSQQVAGIGTSGTGTANTITNSSGTGATFILNLTTGTPTFGGVIAGNLTFEKQGAGTQTLTGANTYTGGTNLNGGILSFAAGSLGSTGNITFTSNSTLRWATGNTEDVSSRFAALPTGVTATLDTNGQTVTLSGTISGDGALTKAGGGTLILSGANTYSGNTTLIGGNLNAGSDSAFGTGSVTLNAATLSLQLGSGVTLSNPVISNSTSDNMIDVPSGSATYAGNFSTAASGQQLRVAATGGGTLNWTGSAPIPGIFVLNMGNIDVRSSGLISGSQALLARPAAESFMFLTLRDNASMSFTGITNIGNARNVHTASVTIQDNASYSTGTTFNLLDTTAPFATSTINLNGGTLTVGSFLKTSTGLDQTATINLNGGTLRPSASSAAFLPALAGLSVQVLSGANIDTNGFDATIGAALVGAGSGGLTKNGAGTLTLTGANTYTGGTTVNAGTLRVTRMHENNAVTINAGTMQILESAPGYGTGHPSGNNAFVSVPSSLSVAAGATLDITNNDVVIDYSGASPLATYEALVASAYNVTGDWQGDGITSSIAAIDGNYIVAIADNATLAAPFGTAQGGPLFSGVDVDLDTILIKFTHRADINLDGLITPDDSAIFGGNYDENQPAAWATGDMNYDGIFTPDDAAIFGGAYDESLASLPEPGSLAGLALLSLGLARRRRRGAHS